ncbi:MAG: transcriptional regulator TbsP [Haloferacaceae archaeon]
MPLATNQHANDLADVLRSALSAAGDDLLVVDPAAGTLSELVSVATEFSGDLPVVRVVATESVLKAATDDFRVASNAADLVEAGRLALRADGTAENTLLVSRDAVLAVVSAGDRIAALSTDDREFVEAAFETYRGHFEDATAYQLRTPPLSRVRETLAAEVGEDALADFDAALDALDDAPAVDEVTISLLVAAKNDVLLYDISKWGENVGIASKATFSRTKTRLEEAGLIDTEKVPIDVGRPRLRLKLGEAAPSDPRPAALVDAVAEFEA